MSILLLLTATVRPADPDTVRRADPLDRQSDYVEAARRWLRAVEGLPVEVVFCDNSGWDLSQIERLVTPREHEIEFVQLGPTEYPPQRGKGFGESLIMDRVIADVLPSRHVEFVAKCTGRLFVRNGDSLLRQARPDVDALCALDARLRFADTRFFVVRKELFADRFRGLGEEIDESRGEYFEHAFARRLFAALAVGARWEPFRTLPLYVGRSATDGTRYDGPREVGEWVVRTGVRAAARLTRTQL